MGRWLGVGLLGLLLGSGPAVGLAASLERPGARVELLVRQGERLDERTFAATLYPLASLMVLAQGLVDPTIRGTVGCGYPEVLRGEPARLPFHYRRLTLAGLRLVRFEFPASGDTLYALPGLDPDRWEEELPRLLAPFLLGASPQFSDALTFFRQLRPRPAALLGYSQGGALVQYLSSHLGLPALAFNSAPLSASLDLGPYRERVFRTGAQGDPFARLARAGALADARFVMPEGLIRFIGPQRYLREPTRGPWANCGDPLVCHGITRLCELAREGLGGRRGGGR